MAKIYPTVARLVWFSPAADDYELSREQAPFAAIVADVHEVSGNVNLAVISKQGSLHPRGFVPLLQEGDAPSEHAAFCTWMPYQVGQSAKSDELVAALTARIEALEAATTRNIAFTISPETTPEYYGSGAQPKDAESADPKA